MVFVCHGTCPQSIVEFVMEFALRSVLLEKKHLKSYSLPKFALGPPLGDHSPAHMSADMLVSHAVGDGFIHLWMTTLPPPQPGRDGSASINHT